MADLKGMQIKIEKRKIAKREGKIVKSLKDLVCDKHPSPNFKVIKRIPNSWTPAIKGKGKELNIYQCESCGKDKKILQKSIAYDCKFCGIVVGNPKEFHRSSSEEFQSYTGGKDYRCRVCDTWLGGSYF